MRVALASALAAWAVCATARGQKTVDLENADFEAGLSGWTLAPGNVDRVTITPCKGAEGNVVRLQADGANLGLNSSALILGTDLDRTSAYRVSARLRFDGLQSGVAAFTVCAYDSAGKRLAQYAVQHWSTSSKPHDWLTRGALMGPGTPMPFPEKAASIRLRVSFHDPKGQCNGTVWADTFTIKRAAPPRFAAWPDSIVADCGDLQVRFESRSFWTLYRIDYKGVRLCKDQFGSHYGSVASIKNLGFIGSGHTENGESEQIDELELKVDGNLVPVPGRRLRAETLTLRKVSRLRDLRLQTQITIADNRILEDIQLTAAKPVELNLLYHAMHPWVTAMSHFAAVTTDGKRIEGKFTGDKGMKIAAPVKWSAVYGESLRRGAVTVVLEVPADLPWDTRYWDVPKRYRKHYLMTFANAIVPTGGTFRYKLLTLPFEASIDTWKDRARELAEPVPVQP